MRFIQAAPVIDLVQRVRGAPTVTSADLWTSDAEGFTGKNNQPQENFS